MPAGEPFSANPFFHRGPIRDPAYFFGRGQESSHIAGLLAAGQSVALSGSRRFGKTSLLFHLAHPQIATSYGLGPETTHWVYLDGGMLDGLEVEWFYGAVDRALGGEADAVPYSQFVSRLRSLADQQLRLILVLDEFELVAANPHFGPALFNHLRGLAAQCPLQFVAASFAPLWHLTFAHRETLSSPFFNIFAPVHLGLFSQAEAVELLATLSARHNYPFTPETITFLLDLAGPHPLFLQVAGYRAFAAASGPPVGQVANLSPSSDVEQVANLSPATRAKVHTQVLADLEPHLLYYWHKLDPESQYTLAALPLLEPGVALPTLERLAQAGLTYEGRYLGSALETFVRQQKVEGLRQGGPFLLDTRQGLAAAGGRPVHLTPTEFAALKLFLDQPGQLLTPEALEAALWPGDLAPDPERARGVIKKLRAALGEAGEALVNRRGQGWLLSLERGD